MTPSHGASLALPRRRFLGRLLLGLAGITVLGRPKRSEAEIQSTEPFLGEIMLFAGNFAPRFWAMCNGQLLPINQNQALFSLLGTQYGGNGTTNFALPDLRGRVAIHQGQGSGLTPRAVGERAGLDYHTLSLAELPEHAHVVRGSSAVGTTPNPGGRILARSAALIPQFAANADTTLAASAIAAAGGGQAHQNTQPVLTLNYIISLTGTFPLP